MTTDTLRKIVSDHLGVEQKDIKDDSAFIDDLGADSLDTIELVMAVEEEFGIEVDDAEWESAVTFGNAVALIDKIRGVVQ